MRLDSTPPTVARLGLALALSLSLRAAAEEVPAYPNASNYRDFRYHAVIIGVDVEPVHGSGSTCHVPFASRLAAFLKGWRCFSEGSVTALAGRRATRQGIAQALEDLHLGARDVLVVYYGGHGDFNGIATSDGGRLSPEELSEAMRRTGAAFKALLVSSCYSGIFAQRGHAGQDFLRPGFAVVTNGKEGGTSTYASQGIGFGPYLRQLLDRKRRARPQTVSVGELAAFIKSRNRYWSRRGDYRLDDGRHGGPADAVLFWN